MSRRRGRLGRDGSGDAKEPAAKRVTPNQVLSRLPSRRGMVVSGVSAVYPDVS